MNNTRRSRLETFSDGVMAIAITLLALELKVPHLMIDNFRDSLRLEVIPLLPSILTFILSFITIAIFWVNHHKLSEHLMEPNRRIVWSNMLFLFFQTLIPFATSAVSENPFHPLSVFTYSLILFGGSLSFTILRYFIHRRANIDGLFISRSLVGPIVYFLAILLAPISVIVSYILLIIPPLYYFLPKSA